jgi:hypothetical protein
MENLSIYSEFVIDLLTNTVSINIQDFKNYIRNNYWGEYIYIMGHIGCPAIDVAYSPVTSGPKAEICFIHP